MAIKIGTISISLSAETASFQTGMEKASQVALNSSKNIERSFNLMSAAIATATGAAVGSIGVLIEKTENAVFNMQKMAQQAGVTIEQFSKLGYAAKVAGMPVDQMAVILTRISHSSYEAASGSKQAAEAYKALGVDVYDAHQHFKTADQLVLELAKKLDQYKDSAAKTGIETMIMGRSGAQAAEFLNVLANRFDEISQKAERLGVVFNMQTAVQAQKLHDSFIDLEQAGFGLSVRLLNAVSPALDQLADKIVAFVSNAENMKKVDEIGQEIAHGVEMAANAIEFLIEHADTLKSLLEAYAGMRIGGFLLPMISSASSATGLLGKLGIAVGNLSGGLIGLGKLGTNLAPLAKDATGYASALSSLAASEGVAATASLALSDAAAAAGASLASLALTIGPIAALAGALYEFYSAFTSYGDLKEMEKQSGASYWEIERAEIKETFTSLTAFKNLFESIWSDKAQFEYREQALASIGKSSIVGHGTKAPGLPDGYNPFTGTMDAAHSGGLQKNLAALPQGSKVDQLMQKLEELKNRAKEAEQVYATIGLDPDEARKAEIQYKIAEFQIQQKKNLDALSEAKRRDVIAQATQAITTEVMVKAATKYKETLLGVTQSVQTTTAEHLAMAAAVGRSAQAMQEAAIAAKVSQEMTKAGGPSWAKNPAMAADAAKLAGDLRAAANAENAEADAKNLSSLDRQVEAQQRLNNAVMQGADARRQAALENEIAQARQEFQDRGDTDNAALERQIALMRQKAQLDHDAEALARADSLNPAQQYRDQEQALRDAVAAAARYHKEIDFTEVLAADYDAWKQFGDAQREALLKTGSMMDGLRAALNKMADDTVSNAKLMYDALNNVVQQLNEAIVKTAMLNTHQPHAVRNIFAGAFRNIGESLMKVTLQKAEGAALQKLGLGTPGKPDGSQGKPFWVKFAQQASKPLNELDQLGGGSGDQSDTSNDLSSATFTQGGLLGSIAKKGMGWLSKLLGGLGGGGGDGGSVDYLSGYADGGDFPGGVPMVVGEKGPEVMIPQASGTVVPNSGLKNLGGGHTFYIDASHSNDPGATVAAVHNYMQQMAPKLIEKSVKAVQDTQRRVPRTKL